MSEIIERLEMPKGSCFWRHRWSTWEQGENTINGKQVAIQSRICVRCQRVQFSVHRG